MIHIYTVDSEHITTVATAAEAIATVTTAGLPCIVQIPIGSDDDQLAHDIADGIYTVDGATIERYYA